MPPLKIEKDGEIGNVSEDNPIPVQGLKTVGAFTESDLVEDKITAGTGVTWKGIDIYNDSETNTLTFALNNTDTFTFTLATGESLINQIFNDFTEITIAGTSPDFRIIVRS